MSVSAGGSIIVGTTRGGGVQGVGSGVGVGNVGRPTDGVGVGVGAGLAVHPQSNIAINVNDTSVFFM